MLDQLASLDFRIVDQIPLEIAVCGDFGNSCLPSLVPKQKHIWSKFVMATSPQAAGTRPKGQV